MVAQYFADTHIAAQEHISDTRMREKLRTYAVEALAYLEVGVDIARLRRQATAALQYMEETNI